jgi:hypothetical protein
MAKRADWTFMVYMAGDNNLSAAGDADLKEMRQVGSTDRVNVLVEFDNAGEHGTRRIRIGKDGAGEVVESLGETDSGSPEVLSSFISWAAENYPADRYALILWNHGGGWEPSEVDRIARSVASPGYNGREISERSSSSLGRAFFRSTLQKVFSLNSSTERAICSDDGTGHSLDTIELGRVIAAGAETIGQPFDLLGMDACLMSNLEVAYQLRKHVRYVVASEETQPGEGWPYDRILGRLVADPGIATPDFAGSIVTDYIAWYTEDYFGDMVTQTAYDLSRINDLLTPLDDLAGYAIGNMEQLRQSIWEAQLKTTDFHGGTLRDIGHFCKELLGQRRDDPGFNLAAAAVVEAHRVGEGRALVAEGHFGTKVKDCHGATVYFPMQKISSYYQELEFARDFRWLQMMQTYFDV